MTRPTSFRGRVGSSRDVDEPLARKGPSLFGGEGADLTDGQTPGTPLPGTILNQIGSRPTRLHPHPETFEGGIPHEQVLAAPVGSKAVNQPLCNFRHQRS